MRLILFKYNSNPIKKETLFLYKITIGRNQAYCEETSKLLIEYYISRITDVIKLWSYLVSDDYLKTKIWSVFDL